jgi:hypothetical protein
MSPGSRSMRSWMPSASRECTILLPCASSCLEREGARESEREREEGGGREGARERECVCASFFRCSGAVLSMLSCVCVCLCARVRAHAAGSLWAPRQSEELTPKIVRGRLGWAGRRGGQAKGYTRARHSHALGAGGGRAAAHCTWVQV